MRVAIDVDGVIRDFIGKLEQEYDSVYKQPEHWRKPVIEYGIHNFFSIGKNIYKFAFEDFAYEIFKEGILYPGAYEFMKQLYDNHTVIIATSQSNHMLIRYTLDWLYDKNILYHEFYATLNGTKSVPADILLDDYTKNLINVRGKGDFPVCMDRPWNRDWNGKRIKEYKEFIGYIESLW